jgi:general secretion pathway protein N
MRARSITAVGVAAYAVFVAAMMPASVLAPRVAGASRGALALTGAHGSAWNGSAHAVVSTTAGAIALDEVRWRFAPGRLASGRIAFAVSATGTGATGHATLERGWGEWMVRALEARIEATALAAALPWTAPWRPEGIVTVASPGLAWNDGGARGAMQVEWRGAAVAISPVHPLGSYRLEAQGDGGPMKLTVATIEGPLRLSGHGTFAPPSQATFSGEARGEGEAARALDPLLDLLGPRRADGARSLELRLR